MGGTLTSRIEELESAVLILARVELYSEDEPRDDRGRWGDAGGGVSVKATGGGPELKTGEVHKGGERVGTITHRVPDDTWYGRVHGESHDIPTTFKSGAEAAQAVAAGHDANKKIFSALDRVELYNSSEQRVSGGGPGGGEFEGPGAAGAVNHHDGVTVTLGNGGTEKGIVSGKSASGFTLTRADGSKVHIKAGDVKHVSRTSFTQKIARAKKAKSAKSKGPRVQGARVSGTRTQGVVKPRGNKGTGAAGAKAANARGIGH